MSPQKRMIHSKHCEFESSDVEKGREGVWESGTLFGAVSHVARDPENPDADTVTERAARPACMRVQFTDGSID